MIPPVRRDKYQKQLKWYWVDVATTGSFQDEQEEQLVDKTTVEGEASSFVGLVPFDPNVQVPGDEPQVGSDDDDDIDNDSGSTRTRGRVPGKNDVDMEYALEAGSSGWKQDI